MMGLTNTAAVASPVVDDEPFVQSDWEFELDTMPSPTRMQLEAHLANAPANNETAAFLKGYLMQSGTFTFTPIA